MRTLIAEDDRIAQRLLTYFLAKTGDVVLVSSGEEAIAEYRRSLEKKERFQLVCLDIMLPGISGKETLMAIRDLEDRYKLQPGIDTAVILMTTALVDPSSLLGSFRSGCDGYLSKPFSKSQFYQELEKAGLRV